jgi:hypothetical protein
MDWTIKIRGQDEHSLVVLMNYRALEAGNEMRGCYASLTVAAVPHIAVKQNG